MPTQQRTMKKNDKNYYKLQQKNKSVYFVLQNRIEFFRFATDFFDCLYVKNNDKVNKRAIKHLAFHTSESFFSTSLTAFSIASRITSYRIRWKFKKNAIHNTHTTDIDVILIRRQRSQLRHYASSLQSFLKYKRYIVRKYSLFIDV